MARIKMEEMEARKRAILRYVAARTCSSEPILVSRKVMMRDLGLTCYELQCALSRLVKQGCIQAVERYLPSGAQIENSYEVTDFGMVYLHLDSLFR